MQRVKNPLSSCHPACLSVPFSSTLPPVVGGSLGHQHPQNQTIESQVHEGFKHDWFWKRLPLLVTEYFYFSTFHPLVPQLDMVLEKLESAWIRPALFRIWVTVYVKPVFLLCLFLQQIFVHVALSFSSFIRRLWSSSAAPVVLGRFSGSDSCVLRGKHKLSHNKQTPCE